jgi:hypothetical protein
VFFFREGERDVLSIYMSRPLAKLSGFCSDYNAYPDGL